MVNMLLTAAVGALLGVLAAAGLVGGLARLRDDPLRRRSRRN
jgi:hypothetical protein